jgi:hypothetical protein
MMPGRFPRLGRSFSLVAARRRPPLLMMRRMMSRIQFALQQRGAILVLNQLTIAHAMAAAQLRLRHRFAGVSSGCPFAPERRLALAIPSKLMVAKALAPAQLGLGQAIRRLTLMSADVTRSARMPNR